MIDFKELNTIELINKYNTAKALISVGHIKSLREIFEVVPKSRIAKDLGIHYDRFIHLIYHVEGFILRDIFSMAKVFQIDEAEMIKLIYQQYKVDKEKLTP